MVTREDFRHNFGIINVGCKLGVIPSYLNTETQQLQVLTSTWKRALGYCYLALYTVHTSYVVFRLPYLLLHYVQLSLVSLLVHFTMMLGMVAILC